MLVWLIKYLVQYYYNFNIFSHLIFRGIMSLITTLFISLYMNSRMIAYLQKFDCNQLIRREGPKSHLNKSNTPTMGGIVILTAITISVVLWSYPCNWYIYYVLIILISYGIIGFIDDYRKVIYQNTKGLVASWKYFWMSIITFIVIFAIYISHKDMLFTELLTSVWNNDLKLQLVIYHIILSYLVIVGTGNAVNLTDGLDGLAIVPIIFVATGFALISLVTGNINYANYLHITYIQYASELVIFCTSVIGAGLGFLWFNTYPAQIFMGDVGSLALGGSLGIIAVFLRQEFLLCIMGGVFVIETLSVIIQVCSFKLYGKRIFRMAPIHHHFELKGCPEPRLIIRFWIISFILMLISLVIFKVY